MGEPDTSSARGARARRLAAVAGGLLIVWGLFNANGDVFFRAFAPESLVGNPTDSVTAFEERLAPLRAATPPDATYGFIGDLTLPPEKLDARFFMAEYALAPRLLGEGANEALVIGVFDGAVAPTLQQRQLQVVTDFGRGVFLLRAAR
jgi:hypothetical protein